MQDPGRGQSHTGFSEQTEEMRISTASTVRIEDGRVETSVRAVAELTGGLLATIAFGSTVLHE